MEYRPDAWVIVKITVKDKPLVYKVLAGWHGGYMGGDAWKLNSGISSFSEQDGVIRFDGYSRSSYFCLPDNERFTGMMGMVFEKF